MSPTMRLSRLIFALLLPLAAGVPALAASKSADAPHVHVELLVPGDNLYTSDDLNRVGLYFKLEPGWHVYWKNPGDAGLPPHVAWTLPAGITAGPMQFPAPKRLPLGPLMDFGYDNEVLFPLTLHVAESVKAGPVTLHAKVDWLVCQERCIPGKAELEVQRNVYVGLYTLLSQDEPLDWRFLERKTKSLPEIPRPLPASRKAVFQPTPQGFRLQVETGQREQSAAFFPADQDILDNPAPQKLTPIPTGLILDLKKDANLAANPAQLKGILELSGGRAFEIAALPPGATPAVAAEAAAAAAAPVKPTVEAKASPVSTPVSDAATKPPANQPATPTLAPPPLSWALLARTSGLAFLGGLLLNLMPCVFPVLFIKGLALVHSGHKELDKMRAHGLVYALGILVSFWALVGLLLGLRAAGATLGWGFQFQSPVFLALMAGLLFFLGLSLAGQFEIGLTLTSAGGALLVDKQGAQKQGYTGSFFTGVLAVVVATPCTAPFMGAAIGYALAQSPVVTFAVFTALALGLAAPYVALTLQPAWTRILPKPGVWMEVLRQAISVPIFATVIWLAWVLAQAYGAGILAALLASFLLLAIAGWFLGRWPAKRWAAAVAVLIVLCSAVLSVISGIDSMRVVPGFDSRSILRFQMTPQEYSKLQHGTGSSWEPWSHAAVAQYQAEGRPVFVDFTAAWCLSCQVNERVALNQPEVKQAFQAAHVALLRADWTRHDEAITQALTALGRSGVPAYALYAPGKAEPEMLPEVLTPGIVTDALANLPKAAR